jgi:hypothetical protein
VKVLVIAKEKFQNLDWLLEDIRDDFASHNIDMVLPGEEYSPGERKYDLLILVKPGFLGVLRAFFMPVKDFMVVSDDFRYYRTDGGKWASLRIELFKEFMFFSIIIRSIMKWALIKIFK